HLAPWAERLIHVFASYSEDSPSGTGAHIIVQATLPGKGFEKSGFFGLYDRGRYFTVTGHVTPAPAPIMARQRSVEDLYLVKDVLIAALARYGERYSVLFAGRWQEGPNIAKVSYGARAALASGVVLHREV